MKDNRIAASEWAAVDYRIDVPNHDSSVFGSSGQFHTIRGKPTEPDFITMIGEYLSSFQW